MALLQFNAEGREGVKEFEAIPAGEYSAIATEADMAPAFKDEATQAHKGNQLVIVWEILEGPYKGRQIYDRLSIQHDDVESDEKKRKMVEIAHRSLTSICNAIGKLQIGDTADLVGIPVNLKLKVEKESTDTRTGKVYPAKNQVANYFPYKQLDYTAQPVAQATSAPAGVPGVAPAQVAAAPMAAPPWSQH